MGKHLADELLTQVNALTNVILPTKQKPSRCQPCIPDKKWHEQILEWSNECQQVSLGVIITHDFSWSKNIENFAARGNLTVSFLRRNFRECTPKVKLSTYTTMVRSTLGYASAVWESSQTKRHPTSGESPRQSSRARYAFQNRHMDRLPGSVTSNDPCLRN